MTPSQRQELVLNYVTRYINERGFAPSLRDICRALGFASPRSAQKHLEALEAEGLIRRESKSRAISLLTEPDLRTIVLPFLGFIAAGAPIEVLEHQETMEVPATLIGRKPCYILQVKGNSMIEDHILNGDFVVVEKCDSADDGEVVVALINRSEATLKRLYREPSRVRLEPANSTMKPIYVKDVAVQGKVRGLFRRF